MLLNISGIRINPAFNATANAPGWVTIPLPQSAGAGNGQTPGDLQLDLLDTQTGAVFYNVSGAPPGTYQTVQVLVDPNLPGNIIPACQSGGSNTEGCTNYPIQFNSLFPVTASLATPLNVSADATAPLVVQIQVSITSPPINTGDPYVADITASEVNFGSFLAQVSGNIKLKGAAKGSHLLPVTVSAELSGTGTVIETVPVRSKGSFTLELPAAPGGTSYDIFSSGGGFTYAALQGIIVTPGQLLENVELNATSATTGVVRGLIADNCTGLGIPGAQAQLLVPAATNVTTPLPTPQATPSASLCLTNPNQCVVVASGSADQAGNYPMPGTRSIVAPFDQVPVGQPNLALQITASGYTPLLSSLLVKTSSQVCSAATSSTQCNFSLTTGYINGTVNLVSDPPPGSSVTVQVFAENSGTNQLVSALSQPLVFVNQETSLPFTLNVPMNSSNTPFDLFAVAIDPFQGGPGPFPGHDIPVLANQPAPNQPKSGSSCLQSTAAAFQAMDCVGHGSISGTVQNPDTGTSVEVEKLDPNNALVPILGTSPALFSSNNPGNNAYTLCVPPDTYTLQRFEVPASSAIPTSTPTPVGSGQTVMVATPVSTSSPCPSTCSNSNTSAPCPGLCNATTANPL